MTTLAVQAPKTVGPKLAGLTIREQAAARWATERDQGRRKAERAAQRLARTIFGNVSIQFDDFVPDKFAQRHHLWPFQLVTFEVEGLEFNYVAPFRDRRGDMQTEAFWLIDECPCGRGPRLLELIRDLADLGRAYGWDYSDTKCFSCSKDAKASERTV